MSTREWLDNVVKELKKHAERDDCYDCKQLLKHPLLKGYSHGGES
jgi:hypothetical protein